MKRLLTRGALLLLLCALLAASGFADVKAEAVCQQDVLFCTDEGLMTGTGRNTFSPDRPIDPSHGRRDALPSCGQPRSD